MSDPQAPGSHREEQVQKAFDDAAEGLGLRLEGGPQPSGEPSPRIVGTAFVAFGKSLDAELMASPPQVGDTDDAAITAVINDYESLDPADLARHWRRYATDPHIAIADGWIASVSEQDFDRWLESSDLEEWMQEYPPFSPRRVQITNVHIVYIGKARAVVTYHIQEESANGKVAAGNGSASLFKMQDGQWRITTVHKRVKEEVATPLFDHVLRSARQEQPAAQAAV